MKICPTNKDGYCFKKKVIKVRSPNRPEEEKMMMMTKKKIGGS
jgi:hypothetical protein